MGLVFDSYIQVLGIRYFQRPCTSYHCLISVGLVFDSYIRVLGIRYFQWPCILYHCCIHIYTYVFHLLKPVSMKLSTCKIVELIRIHYWTWYLIPNTLIHWAENIKSLPHYCPVMKFLRHIFKEELCLWSHGCPGANILRFFWNAHRLAWKIRTSLRLHRKIYPGPSSPDIILKIYLSLYFKVEYLHLGFPLLDFVPRNCVFEILAGRSSWRNWKFFH